MIKKISSTFGSWQILKQIQKNNPSRKMIVLSSSSAPTDLQLLDVSGEEPVFNNPLSYDILAHHGNQEWTGFFRFAFFSLGDDDLKVFDSKVNQLITSPDFPLGLKDIYVLKPNKKHNDRVLLTIWQLDSDYSLWKRSATYQPFAAYTNTNFRYHDTNYTAYNLN
ncbi:hypothetical protein [Pediococcus argentinicus]|uniref:Monooxygenase n=1 Tax=Pediococcus argentinicus TaxID=480391 RepID=A0A0R2N4K8_9LACO|nr:hypothetical protein [Pediococcus argentinicus]KRO20743.1 hypothetical protein IV88_GL001491 [Pediococcus argentinicus]NKZ23171.1 monooxygenase [Pediococcus argentinicus]GEP20365.1 hypothetical protein LSA03_17490 [Pediococcus argentinicus]